MGKLPLNQRLMPGLTPASLKQHPALAPLLVAIGGGMVFSMAYLLRLAVKNPDVCWDKVNNPYPWQKLKQNYRYKFYVADKNNVYTHREFPAERPDI